MNSWQESFRNFVLGELLHLANCNPPTGWRHEFYLLKDTLLNRYATYVGRDLQHIRKECYGCNGSGKHQEEHFVFGQIWYTSSPCSRCGTTGVYEEFWVNLKRYRLGRHEFHCPLDRFCKEADAGIGYLAVIDGYIRHPSPKYYLYAEAAFWLALLFDRPLFLRRFGRSGYPSRKFTPMVILSTWLFGICHLHDTLRQRWYRIGRGMMKVRQSLCRHHDFGEMEMEHVCKKCGFDNPRWEVPF